MMAVLGVFLVIMAGNRALAGPDGKDVPRVAFFGFEFINTSLEPTAQAEVERIRLLDDVLRQKLTSSERFEVVDFPPDTAKEIASVPAISNCNGCQREFAQRAGASWAAWGTVQKVSNLILNINVYMENAASGKMEFGVSTFAATPMSPGGRGSTICCAIICFASLDLSSCATRAEMKAPVPNVAEEAARGCPPLMGP
jgi:Protein of unknown function (DUF2380)